MGCGGFALNNTTLLGDMSSTIAFNWRAWTFCGSIGGTRRKHLHERTQHKRTVFVALVRGHAALCNAPRLPTCTSKHLDAFDWYFAPPQKNGSLYNTLCTGIKKGKFVTIDTHHRLWEDQFRQGELFVNSSHLNPSCSYWDGLCRWFQLFVPNYILLTASSQDLL